MRGILILVPKFGPYCLFLISCAVRLLISSKRILWFSVHMYFWAVLSVVSICWVAANAPLLAAFWYSQYCGARYYWVFRINIWSAVSLAVAVHLMYCLGSEYSCLRKLWWVDLFYRHSYSECSWKIWFHRRNAADIVNWWFLWNTLCAFQFSL